MILGMLCRPRLGGKTTQLVEMFKRNPNAVLAVHSQHEAKHIIEKYRLDPDRVITYHQLRKGVLRGRVCGLILIDNVEFFLADAIDGYIGQSIVASASGYNL